MTTLWLPLNAILIVFAALAMAALSYVLARRQRWHAAIVLMAIAALLIRGYASADRVLHPWDERYHALVAKNLIERPLVPTLYRTPVLPYDYRTWTSNHVWLHKPPLALWAQAASMKVFGVHEFPVRLPSLLISTASVVLTYAIGSILLTPAIELLAAGFQTFNGFLVDLTSGRRASDHVDTLLVFLFELGILCALVASRRRPRVTGVALGAVTGLAYLTKSFLGLLILPVWAAMRSQLGPRSTMVKELAIAGVLTAIIAAPWTLYTSLTFPLEAAYERTYALRHINEVMENQGGPPWKYLWEMPRFFGELVYVPIAMAAFWMFKGGASAERRAILLWLAIPYLLFSAFATKMPGYVMVAAPAIFLVQADFWVWLWQRRQLQPTSLNRALLAFCLFLLAVLPARHLLGPTGPLEHRDRNPKWVRDLRALNEQIGDQQAVVFNIANTVDAMFYTPYIVYEYLPSADQVRELRRRGYRVYLFEDGSAPHVQPPADVTVIRSE